MLPACRDLIDAGVTCLAIGSRERRSEYVSAFTDVWATAIRESQLPAEPELERLERVFLPWGAAKKIFTKPPKRRRRSPARPRPSAPSSAGTIRPARRAASA